VLYNKALELARIKNNETVVDAYCGIGTIALFFAHQAKQVIGVEVIAEAVEDAKHNAVLNGITNTEFIPGKVEIILPRMLDKEFKPNVVILDPPRQGCAKEVLEAIALANIPRVVYVSCDPATMARDLSILSGYNYQTLKVQPVDMFPWTGHVECVVRIERR
ncbi:23S rRNA (uracil(1939)-C(5))-methyltransferase RlmD, partial [Desulforamulus aquiferis]